MEASDAPDARLPDVFINVIKKNNKIECSTLDLAKRNQKIVDSHNECLLMSDKEIAQLLDQIRVHAQALMKVGESIGMLDMISAFGEVVIRGNYTRPVFGDTIAIRAGRHPIKDQFQRLKFIPNDVLANRHHRFNIITGCNMSGKSTYIRSVALISIMAQIGCFVPAEFATCSIRHKLFARVSVDDRVEANMSTFSAEMREMAFILRNVDKQSLVIIDELGRGTSSRDGLAIAIAIAEALVDSEALIWFVTHFVELAQILGERVGVVNLHLAVDMPDANTLNMLYKVSEGHVKDRHYGITLARTMPLPEDVLSNAATVANDLQERLDAQRRTSQAVSTQRRRRLLLKLKYELSQAEQSDMQGELLRDWLKQLKHEFLNTMSALEEEARSIAADDGAEMSGSNDQMVENEEEGQDTCRADDNGEVDSTSSDLL